MFNNNMKPNDAGLYHARLQMGAIARCNNIDSWMHVINRGDINIFCSIEGTNRTCCQLISVGIDNDIVTGNYFHLTLKPIGEEAVTFYKAIESEVGISLIPKFIDNDPHGSLTNIQIRIGK